jgi:hypothetical protein
MIKIIKKLLKLNQEEENFYEEVEQLIDHEDGNVTCPFGKCAYG